MWYSFRLLTEYHSFLLSPPPYFTNKWFFNSFRLLTEYHSFLSLNRTYRHCWKKWVSVSLRSIIHSYYSKDIMDIIDEVREFPSPYGVSFILIWGLFCWDRKLYCIKSFRLLTEYHSFLSYGQKSLLLQYVFRMLSYDIFIFAFFLFISVKSILNSSFFEYRLTNIFL